jgi:asparagine synthase (glutamine-hydrolysing)
MCGIGGIISLNGRLVDPVDIGLMMAQLVHRGPDDHGVFLRHNIGLGFQRLSIVDLSRAGHQPMTTTDQRYTIVYNGEVYNFREIRRQLETQRVVFRSQSDTEVVLQAFATWGTDCLERLHGMFAFCIYDELTEETYLVRDRFGIKPVYLAEKDGQLLFSSEIGGLLPCLQQRSVNRQMAFDYLVHDRIDHTDQTFYAGVTKLAPGHWLRIRDGKRELRRWYHLPDRLECMDISDEAYRDLFTRTVRSHAMTEVPIGISLSGGIDSSSITGVLLQESDQLKVNTFSAVYGRGVQGDESQFIDTFIQLGAITNFVTPTADSLYADLRRFTHAIGEPCVRTGPYAQFKVMELASQQVKVILDGQGADEILAGYPMLSGHYYHSLLRQGQWSVLGIELFETLKHRSGMLGLQTAVLQSLPQAVLRRISVAACRYVDKNLARQCSRESTVPDIFYRPLDLRDALVQMTTHKLQHLLKWTDHNSMYFSIESRVPFLDHTFVEATLSLPAHRIIRKGMRKHILRSSMRGLVPDAILLRRDKIGFGTPEDEWFRQPAFQQVIQQAVNSTVLKDSGLVDLSEMRRIIARHMSGVDNHARAIWKCLHLWLWLSKL